MATRRGCNPALGHRKARRATGLCLPEHPGLGQAFVAGAEPRATTPANTEAEEPGRLLGTTRTFASLGQAGAFSWWIYKPDRTDADRRSARSRRS